MHSDRSWLPARVRGFLGSLNDRAPRLPLSICRHYTGNVYSLHRMSLDTRQIHPDRTRKWLYNSQLQVALLRNLGIRTLADQVQDRVCHTAGHIPTSLHLGRHPSRRGNFGFFSKPPDQRWLILIIQLSSSTIIHKHSPQIYLIFPDSQHSSRISISPFSNT